jgi:hypothetical protein
MNEDDRPVLRKNHIRSARQFRMQPEPEALTMQHASDAEFGLRVPAANAGHHPTPRFRIDYIDHRTSSPSTGEPGT